MKHLLITFAAVLLVACASKPEYSGSYSLTIGGTSILFQLKSDGTFIGSPKDVPEGVNDDAVGTWKVEGDLLVCEGTITENPRQITFKFDKTNFKLISLAENGQEAPLLSLIPEGESIYMRKLQQSAPAPEAEPSEPVAEAKKTEQQTAKATDISIHKAAENGNIEAVKQHLAAGTDVNIKEDNEIGLTPLHYATAEGHKEIVELLITKTNVNIKNNFDFTPLHMAASQGHKEIAELLIDKSANVNAKSSFGSTPLHGAVGGPNPNWKGSKDIVELLIVNGADVNAKEKSNGWTPLHNSVIGRREYGKKEIVEKLIANGANVNAEDNRGWTPLKFIYNEDTGSEDCAEVLKILRKHGGTMGSKLKDAKVKPNSPPIILPNISIQNAVFNGNIEAVKKHLDSGVDVNAKDAQGMAPLHLAAWRGHKEIAEILIAKGADVSTKANTSGGETPLHMAAMEGHKEIAELLIAEGANVNAKNNSGWIPLHDVSFEGHKEIAKLLIDKGSDVNVKGRKMQTALHVSAGRGHQEIVKLLIVAEADVNPKARNGDTPLDRAKSLEDESSPEEQANKEEIADLLRKNGGKTSEELKAEGK